MEAGIADHVWTLDEIVDLLEVKEESEEKAKGPRRTRGLATTSK
jgi:hypothetical protein